MADVFDLQSRIAAVTLYRRGAAVTRLVTLSLADGLPERVRIAGLPLGLDDSSVRVEVRREGDGQTVIAGDLGVTLTIPRVDIDVDVDIGTRAKPADVAAREIGEARCVRELIEAELGALRTSRGRMKPIYQDVVGL